jgi:hypothetical protein
MHVSPSDIREMDLQIPLQLPVVDTVFERAYPKSVSFAEGQYIRMLQAFTAYDINTPYKRRQHIQGRHKKKQPTP